MLGRHRLDVVVDHRLRTAPRPAPGADGDRDLRSGAARRPARLPALLRADAAAQPGGAAASRRGRPGDPATGRCRARRRAAPGRPRRRRATARGSRRRPRAGLAVDPGRRVVRDVARLAGRRRPADRPDRGSPGRARRSLAPGAPHRLRGDRRARRRRLRRVAPGGPSGRVRGVARGGRPGARAVRRRARRAVRHRRPPARRVRERPRPGRPPHHGRRPAVDPREAAGGPPHRDHLREWLPFEHRRLAAPLGRLPACRGGVRRRPGLAGPRLPARLRRRHRRARLACTGRGRRAAEPQAHAH